MWLRYESANNLRILEPCLNYQEENFLGRKNVFSWQQIIKPVYIQTCIFIEPFGIDPPKNTDWRVSDREKQSHRKLFQNAWK